MKQIVFIFLICLPIISCTSIPEYGFEQRIVLQGKKLPPNGLIKISASQRVYYSEIVSDNIIYWAAIKQNHLIYIRTSDIHFETEDKLSVNSTVAECIEKHPDSVYVEPAVCIFVQLENGWRACISTDLENIPLGAKIQYFYKTDNNYYWTLTKWIDYIRQDAEFPEETTSSRIMFLPAENDWHGCYE